MMKSSLIFAWRLGLLALALGAGVGCAYGSTIDPEEDDGSSSGDGFAQATGAGAGGSATSGATSGPTSSATSGSSGAGGDASSSTGPSGVGGGATSSSGAGGSMGVGGGGNGLEGTATTVLSVLAGAGSSSVIASAADLVAKTGFATPFIEQTSDPVALAVTGTGVGVLVVRAAATGDLRYAQWNGSWVPGFGMPLAPVQAGLLLEGGPSIAGTTVNSAHVAYRRSDSKLYYAAITSGFWSPTEEPIGSGADQSTSPASPAIANLGLVGDAMAFFVGPDGDLWDRTRTAGVWQAPNAHGLAGTVASISPAVASLASGPELVVVFADAATHALQFTTLSNGSWAAPEAIPNATCDEIVSLTALPSEGAAVAWRAPDGSVHAAVYDPAASPAWTEPPGLPAATLVGPPAISAGGLGARAELMWVDTTYITHTSRLVAGAWTAPVFGGGSGERIALATGK